MPSQHSLVFVTWPCLVSLVNVSLVLTWPQKSLWCLIQSQLYSFTMAYCSSTQSKPPRFTSHVGENSSLKSVSPLRLHETSHTYEHFPMPTSGSCFRFCSSKGQNSRELRQTAGRYFSPLSNVPPLATLIATRHVKATATLYQSDTCVTLASAYFVITVSLKFEHFILWNSRHHLREVVHRSLEIFFFFSIAVTLAVPRTRQT